MEQLPDYNSKNAHEIDYRIYGEEMQYVEIELDPQEAVIAEAGTFMMMDDGIKMETIFGDGSKKDTGFLGKILGAGKRILTGESLFMTAFYNDLVGKRNVPERRPKVNPHHQRPRGDGGRVRHRSQPERRRLVADLDVADETKRMRLLDSRPQGSILH